MEESDTKMATPLLEEHSGNENFFIHKRISSQFDKKRSVFSSYAFPLFPLGEVMELGASSSSLSSGHLGGRAIDRYNPIITDSRRIVTPTPTPASTPSRLAAPDVSHLSRRHRLQKGTDKCKGVSRPNPDDDDEKKIEKIFSFKGDMAKSRLKQKGMVSKGCNNDSDGISLSGTPPAVSTRHLLGDIVLFDDERPAFPSVSPDRTVIKLSNEDHKLKLASSSPSKAGSDQVVVLRVSLHCRGCARKVRKHLSKMEGVTSFNIDFAAKKVTVIGDVTPLSVLGSISKVKNAQFWPFPSPLPS